MIDLTSKSEQDWRDAIVVEATSWLHTPFMDVQCVKGEGVDCAGFLYGVYKAVGLVDPDVKLPKYSFQWHLHQDRELFREFLEGLGGHETNNPKPGDAVLYKFGRTLAHGAIILPPGFPHIIHAAKFMGEVSYGEGDDGWLGGEDRQRKYFTVF